jgi:pimeloyl-ACP methyl ester carboxylesterase
MTPEGRLALSVVEDRRGQDRTDGVVSGPVRRRTVRCAHVGGLHRMSYLEWGDPANPRVVVCVHGLTRSARDFDYLAAAMCEEFRVICPDVAGRGQSEWLRDPMAYVVPTYANDMVTLLARADVESVRWVGTSMGGLIGLALAAVPDSPIEKLVLNDVGAVVDGKALDRIGGYVGVSPAFATIEAAEGYIRTVSATFGPHTDAEWRFLTENVVSRQADGTYRMHYDPAIAFAANAQQPHKSVDLWMLYDSIRCPTLVLRGELSDLLTRDTARQMTERGPRARLVEFGGVGHAPTLIHPDQIAVVRDFLLEPTRVE